MTSDDAVDHAALLERWRRASLHRYTCADVKRLLARRFNAYEIPLDAMSAEDYANDEEVDEQRIATLLTITDPRVLDGLYGEAERAHKVTDPAEVDADWREALTDEDLTYSLLLIQHAHGTRTSVVLERDGPHATGFKVYGTSFLLNDLLCALIGVRGMRPGDLSDPDFRFYLECLAAHGRI